MSTKKVKTYMKKGDSFLEKNKKVGETEFFKPIRPQPIEVYDQRQRCESVPPIGRPEKK